MTDYLINPCKYLLAAFLLFEGARTRINLLLGLGAITAQAGLYALRVIHYVPPGVLLMSENPFRDRISRECGLHPNDMALVMVVGFWCIASCLVLWRHVRWWWRLAGIGGLLMTFVSLAFGVFRWRPLLVILPISLVLTAILFPSVASRVGEGVGVKSIAGDTTYDADAISSGRLTDLWPPTADKIVHSPLVGFGRMAILRTDLYDQMLAFGTVPQHPHNAYLEMLLDAGLIGLVASLALYIGFPVMALWRGTPPQPLLDAAVMTGATAAAAMLLMAITGQSFFPREGVFTVLCAYALMIRAHLIRVSIESLSECAPYQATRLQHSHSLSPVSGIPQVQIRRGG
jgi:O-antigen ligase